MKNREKTAACFFVAALLTSCDQTSSRTGDNSLKPDFIVGLYSTLPDRCEGPTIKVDRHQISFRVPGHAADTYEFLRSEVRSNNDMTSPLGPVSTAHLVVFREQLSLVWLTLPVQEGEPARVHMGVYALERQPEGDLFEGVDLRNPSLEFGLYPCPDEV